MSPSKIERVKWFDHGKLNSSVKEKKSEHLWNNNSRLEWSQIIVLQCQRIVSSTYIYLFNVDVLFYPIKTSFFYIFFLFNSFVNELYGKQRSFRKWLKFIKDRYI